MIANFFIDLLTAMVTPLINLLPSGGLNLPNASVIATPLGQLDSLLPIGAPLLVAMGMLAALVAFFGLRFAIFIWQQVKW